MDTNHLCNMSRKPRANAWIERQARPVYVVPAPGLELLALLFIVFRSR